MARRTISLQWHLTRRCSRRCAHCYMFDGADHDENRQLEPPLRACLRIIEQFMKLAEDLGDATGIIFEPRFILSGGDPLLHPDFWQILEAIPGERTMVLGNPDRLDPETVMRLRDSGVRDFQLSLDGLEDAHDRMRGAGSFRQTTAAIALLRDGGITPRIMSTVYRGNLSDLPRLVEFASEVGAGSFAFARATAHGNARDLDLAIEPQEYRALLLEVHEKQESLRARGSETLFPRKDHLWTLLLHELGDYHLYPHVNPGKTRDGCHLGQSFLVLLEDGTATACRRFPSPVGRFPDQTLSEIFLRSPQLSSYRKVSQLEKCSECELLLYCRGCPAVAHGTHGDWRRPDPQCWR